MAELLMTLSHCIATATQYLSSAISTTGKLFFPHWQCDSLQPCGWIISIPTRTVQRSVPKTKSVNRENGLISGNCDNCNRGRKKKSKRISPRLWLMQSLHVVGNSFSSWKQPVWLASGKVPHIWRGIPVLRDELISLICFLCVLFTL